MGEGCGIGLALAALLLAAGLAAIATAKPHKPKTTTKRVSVRSNGSEVNSDNDFGAVSGNGRFVTFESVGRFTKGDSSRARTSSATTARPARPAGPASSRMASRCPGGEANDSSISNDGRFVAFHAAGAFVPGDKTATTTSTSRT